MQIYKIDKLNAKDSFIKLGADKLGANILKDKVDTHLLYIKNINVGGANILKQDALSIGADVVVPRGTILADDKYVDIILVGTTKHFKILSKKEKLQPFGLKELAYKLKYFINNKKYSTKIMAVLNINDDSFYEKSRYKKKEALKQIVSMINQGADIIDIGAVSSRPGSKPVSTKEELDRIKYICDTIKEQKLYKKAIFSIDSYTPKVVKYALNSGFKIVNDITGLKNNKIAKLVAKYNATIVIMHMQGTPKDMQNDPKYDNVILDIDNFFAKQIKKAKKYNIKNIVLDVGIGFGKKLEHNLILLKNMEHFRHFGYELLIGASRKSMIDMIVKSDVSQRLPGTLAIHLDSINKGASIVRTHDVAEHYQAIKIQEAIQNTVNMDTNCEK
jgi:dihydropteroate synthase